VHSSIMRVAGEAFPMPSDDRLLQALGARIGLEQQAHLPRLGTWQDYG